MKRIVLVVPLLAFLPGCSVLCSLLGQFAGQFEGDAQGDVMIEVMENPDDEEMADVEIRLSAPPLDVFGSAVVSCDDGKFSAKLETEDNPDFGDFEGFLRENAGDGEWSFNTGEQGTWDIVKMD